MSTSTEQLAARLAGAAWGLLVGDAMGVPYEFTPATAIGEVRWGAPGGPWNVPAGTWSDDGALMLALLDSHLEVGFDLEDQARRSLAWMRDGAYTPEREGRFDIGGTTSAALRAYASGTPAEAAGPVDERACGNGSLMRILPVALVGRDLPDPVLVERAGRASRVTHGHPNCQVACALHVLIVARLLRGIEPSRALADARAALRAQAGETVSVAAVDALEGWAGRNGRGFVLDSFWSAWDAFAGAGSYEEAIVRAIRYGNDTDTTAAIAGGLAGAWFGWDGIPAGWRNGMRDGGVAAPIIDRLVETTGARTSTGSPIRVDLVPLDDLGAGHGGRLGITFLPGKKRDGWTGAHWRDLRGDAARLADLGVDLLLLLNEDHELARCRVPDLVPTVEAAGVPVRRFPIEDPRPPRDHDAYAAMVGEIAARLRAGAFVAVACRGGLDRSGMTAAAILVALGLGTEAAIDRVRASREGSLTSGEQLDYLRERWRR